MSYVSKFIGIVGCIASVVSAGCGGSLSDGTGTQSTGTLVDYTIEGVTYETPSQSGVTDADGTYGYKTGETITFKIGDTVLGSLKAKKQISLLDLAGLTSLPTTAKSISNALNLPAPFFRRLSNILILLETLDDDADSSNGIKIPTAVAALLDGVSLKITDTYTAMTSNFALLKLLNQANTDNLFSVDREIAATFISLQNYYTALDVDPAISAPSAYSYDETGDNVLDRTELVQFDERGIGLYFEERPVPDTGATRTNQVSCSATGRLTDSESDNPAGGSVETVIENEYYSYGALHVMETDEGGNGSVNSVETYIYNFSTNTLRKESDYNNSGPVDAVLETEFNDDGQPIFAQSDLNNDGTFESNTTYTYDSQGRLFETASDADGEGSGAATIDTYFYDSQNRVVKILTDFDGDGTDDSQENIAYHSSGAESHHGFTDDPDGPEVAYYDYTYTTNGSLLTSIQCLVFPSMDPICLSRIENTYDSHGNLTREETDSDNDGNVDSAVVHTYDSQNRLTKTQTDLDNSGTFEFTVNTTAFTTTGVGYFYGCI